MTSIIKLRIVVALLLVTSMVMFGQYVPSKERGNPAKRTKTQMEGNRIRATYFNNVQTGRTTGQAPITEQTPYEWPKNTGQVYLALQGIFVGGEVTDNTGARQRIIDVCNYRSSPEGKTWNFEPVPGYFNETTNEIATSVNSDTWPSYWPDRQNDDVDPGWSGSWNGYFGKNIFNADQELFYRSSDDLYDRYTNYFPDSTDLTRKGLGIIVEVRALAWTQVLVQDAIYTLHNIKNDGTKDIDKVGVTVWYADFVGGDGDSNDDISEFDLLEDIAWTRDNDHRAPTFGSDPVGIVAVAFLETPGNAIDRIDNDGDSPEINNFISEAMIEGETPDNLVDDNGNGLIDENQTHIPFGVQRGVTYADKIAQALDPGFITRHPRFKVEEGSPVVTQDMIDHANSDPLNNKWKLWPAPDDFQNGEIHLIMVTQDKLGLPFKDGIDNDNNGEDSNPVITQEMINSAASDAPFYRYKVSSKVTLYNIVSSTLGMKYADGIDNDGNGAVDEGIDEGIDVLIDEARDNGIDDDFDWNPLRDDVGLDGVADSGDEGENDGRPTSGAKYGLPGEPGVDVTDVSETDQIGITNADYVPAGGLNINSDAQMWFDFMIPGKFYDPQEVVAGEYDLFVTSSLFPLRSGQQEPISLVVLLANGPVPDPGGQYRKNEILRKRVRAQETYDNDYRFANAPLTPTLTAVPGNNRVTLYWDYVAESSFDAYIDAIGGIGRDFEGYKIYRASDPAFQDAEQITNGYGNIQFKLPIAQFDLQDGIAGFDSVGIDGVKYFLGTDSGLKHSFIDTTVQNGFTYYYAVVAYDFGYPAGEILPSESPIRVSLKADGSVKLGSNVTRITPDAAAAGYVPPSFGEVKLAEGLTTSSIGYNVVDMNEVKQGHVYHVTFEDTLKISQSITEPDTLITKNYTVTDSTAGVIVIDKFNNIDTDDQPIRDGFQLKFNNYNGVDLDRSISAWSDTSIVNYQFERFVFPKERYGIPMPYDYAIEFGEVGTGTSSAVKIGSTTFPSKQVNFKVYNKGTGKYIDFAFLELDGNDGKLTTSGAKRDRIVFLEPDNTNTLVRSWWFYLLETPSASNNKRYPQNGDRIDIKLRKPLLSGDKFRFVASEATIDAAKAKAELENVKVVPNPYVATAQWEPKNPYASGRGPRSLHFTHLPSNCTIRIFTVNGELVDVIEHNSQINDGSEEWKMLTKDNLNIAYGVYVYHIEAPGIGEKTGKFAVIK